MADSKIANFNYFKLIQNAERKSDFKISDKIKLKAKQRYEEQMQKTFSDRNNISSKYGVSISFLEQSESVKQSTMEDNIQNYSYSLNYIKQNNDHLSLFHNFRNLFEYLDEQGRIKLVSKKKGFKCNRGFFGRSF